MYDVNLSQNTFFFINYHQKLEQCIDVICNIDSVETPLEFLVRFISVLMFVYTVFAAVSNYCHMSILCPFWFLVNFRPYNVQYSCEKLSFNREM